MRIFNIKNGKLTNIKQQCFSNYSNYTKVVLGYKNSKSNSMNNIINKMYLKKNNKKISDVKKVLFEKNVKNTLAYSNEFEISQKKPDNIIQRYYMREQNIYKNLLEKFTKFKENNNIRNFSFSNNLINSKVNQFEESIKSKNSQLLQNEIDNFWKEKKEEINDFKCKSNYNKKNGLNSLNYISTKTNINIKDNLDDEEAKIKINNIKNKGFNNILNKYISKNIINNLKSFNKIRHLIRSNGFSLNLNDIKNVYKENNNKNETDKNERIDTSKMIMVKKLEKKETPKKEKNENHLSFKDKESSENIFKKISRNRILPLIKSEVKEKPNKFKIILNLLSNKNDVRNFKYYNKEFTIKKEVHKYYLKNNYNSMKDFFNDWVKNNKNYLTINDIEIYLNRVIKISVPITRDDLIKIFFNNKPTIDYFDFYDFKTFFSFSDINNRKNISNEMKKNLSKAELNNIEKTIISRILDCKDILFDKLENKKVHYSFRFNNEFWLNYEEFYSLIKENLILYQNNHFDIAIKKIFVDNYNVRKNKIDFLNFIYKMCEKYNKKIDFENKNNNSELHNNNPNFSRPKFLHRINSLKDDVKNSFKNRILGKDETFNNSERKITNIIKIDKNSCNNFNRSVEYQCLNKFTKYDQENKKNKNSDIINII